MPDPAREPQPQAVDPAAARRKRLKRRIGIAAHILIPLVVVYVVWHDVRKIDLAHVRDIVEEAPRGLILLSIGAAGCAVGVMGLYDVLAFPYHRRLPARTRWILSLLFFAWTNFLTLGPIGGPGLRLYFYSRRGLEAAQILRGIVRLYAGLFAGMSSWLVASLLPIGEGGAALAMRAVCALVLAPLISLTVSGLVHRFRPGSQPPPGPVTLAVLGWIGVVDWAAAFASFVIAGRAVDLYLPLGAQLRAVFVGHAAGVVSMVPGGLGAADAVWLKMLTAAGADPSVAAAQVLLFRVCFYIVPWLASFLILSGMLVRRRGIAAR